VLADFAMNWVNEFLNGWRGRSDPSFALKMAFSAFCLVEATLLRFAFYLIQGDVAFSPYYPAILFATFFGGVWSGIITAIFGGVLGFGLDFGEPVSSTVKTSLLSLYAIGSGLAVWGLNIID
jgi:hypothetical protein